MECRQYDARPTEWNNVFDKHSIIVNIKKSKLFNLLTIDKLAFIDNFD